MPPAQNRRRTNHIWKRGSPPTSIKSLNASVASTLPSQNAAISRSLAAFTRMLLGVDQSNKAYPMTPSPEELQQLANLTQPEIMMDQLVFALNPTSASATLNDKEMIEYKNRFMADLQNHNIHRFTFAWDLPDSHHWNRTMAVFVVKHWRYAREHGAFKNYGINSSHNTEMNCISLVLRWLRGRAEDIRLNRGDTQKLLLRERARKRRTHAIVLGDSAEFDYPMIQLFNYRQETIKRHLKVDPMLIMPDADCCSDTEWYPDQVKFKRVGLKWRSQQYENLIRQIDGLSFNYKATVDTPALAITRFDQCRIPGTSFNPKAAVCCGLPENCYNAVFLSGLTYEHKKSLDIKPVVDLDQICEEIRNL
ncbi:uncharacterized protein MELLADRAFT_63681 [Melampsora larici-populina 98AG31]|uniref:Uncharacterized protein n=1 Tax=Melampsora larici-populina (strain 98AG31 / pathotype 3-4-7) TaxID=747676 RepID=F4RNK9_MELLP|nr:uncharacterized protein MELLADRAFT_63681 [Melampsora larici-populina 98AG31]EGG06004.1 hypothetical protein MELLADRAFT_63681 [Melampsora larici-populina 98AG31]